MFDFCDTIIDIEFDSSELLTKFNLEVFKMFDFCDIIIDIELDSSELLTKFNENVCKKCSKCLTFVI